MALVDFWFSIGSTYSNLTVMRLPDVARAAGVQFRWCPYNVRHVMTVQNNIPFKDKPEKTAHMWRDIQRRAARYGLSPMVPAPYPLTGLALANQVAVLGCAEGWVQAYTQATYQRWFDQGQPAGEEPNLTASLTEIGEDPERVMAAARSQTIVEALAATTRDAMALGVFGTPSFIVQGELFWGDDRLEDAIDWAKRGTLA